MFLCGVHRYLHSASVDTDNTIRTFSVHALSVRMGNIAAPDLSKSKLSSRHSLISIVAGHVSTLIARVH